MDEFSDSVNGGSVSGVFLPSPSPALAAVDSLPPDIVALRRLSANLSALFASPSPSFADFTLAVGASSLSLHRCVLTARSPFFSSLLAHRDDAPPPPSRLELREILNGYEVGYEALVLVFGYVYGGKVGPLPRGVCECADGECGHEACWPAVDFTLQVIFASHTFEIWELLSLFQRHLLGILEKVDADDIPVILSVANLCGKSCERLLVQCIEMIVDSDLDTVALQKTLPQDIVRQITDLRTYVGLLDMVNGNAVTSKHILNIHKALDSDDIELVKLLLKEGRATLDDAYALHYAVAYCNSKVTSELLDLKTADVNRRNLRGHSVLHVAARRKDPEIIMCLLDKGAHSYDLTSDGRKAIQISKRLTKAVDYYKPIEPLKNAPKDRLCIEILEQHEREGPPMMDGSSSVAMAGNEQLQKLLYLEARVGLAKFLYPVEAGVAMVNAHVDGTSEFSLTMLSIPAGYEGTRTLSEIPFVFKEEHLSRMRALSKTVELGKRYFSRCSEVISRFIDHDAYELSDVENGTSEGRRKRYLELQEEFMEAFLQDKQELDGSIPCSRSSKSVGRTRPKSARRS